LTHDGPDDEPAVQIPLTGELDLHAFAPRDIPSVVEEYVRACAEAGLTVLRLVHGRGKGVQRAVVRKVLARMPQVGWCEDATSISGGWGATIVHLRGPEKNAP
jgi:DNA-nicking Smr family endonuclease